MGFGNIASQLIIFIVVMSLSATVAVTARGYVLSTVSSLGTQKDVLSEQMKTQIAIELSSYDSSSDETRVYVKNIGNTMISLENVDVFIDGARVPRSLDNRTIEVMADTDTLNIGVWDRGEVVYFMTNMTLKGGITHTITVSTGNGVSDEDIFS